MLIGKIIRLFIKGNATWGVVHIIFSLLEKDELILSQIRSVVKRFE